MGRTGVAEELCVYVSAPGHLHVGNYELSYLHGRILGTIGVAVAHPRTSILACPSDSLAVEAPGDTRGLVEWAATVAGGTARIRVLEEVPRGIGLGGTTALVLAVAVAVKALQDTTLTAGDVEALAERLGRRKWTALGLYSFLYGGLIVDTGRRGAQPPRLLYRTPLPASWRIVTVVLEDHVERIRSLKKREDEILENLSPAPSEYTARVARIALSGIMACAAEADYECLARSMSEYNRVLGDYWRRHGQTSIYCCEEAEQLARQMEEYGTPLVQSSWGPTLWAIAKSPEHASTTADRLRKLADNMGCRARITITRPDNYGAVVVPGNIIAWRSISTPVAAAGTPATG